MPEVNKGIRLTVVKVQSPTCGTYPEVFPGILKNCPDVVVTDRSFLPRHIFITDEYFLFPVKPV